MLPPPPETYVYVRTAYGHNMRNGKFGKSRICRLASAIGIGPFCSHIAVQLMLMLHICFHERMDNLGLLLIKMDTFSGRYRAVF